MAKAISLGRAGKDTLLLTPKQRETHVHIIGGSGKGKSRLMEAMIRQDIDGGHGLCIIDPHGSLYDALLAWIAKYPAYQQRKIVLFEPGLTGHVVGYNPLAAKGRKPTAVADTVLEALARATNTDLSETPRLQRVLKAVLYALIEQNLTLSEAMYLVEPSDPHGVRPYLTGNIEYDHYRRQWQSYNEMAQSQGGRRFREEFESSYNRLNQLLDDPTLRLMFGQQERVLTLRRYMDEGWIVLVNLGLDADVMSLDDALTLGTLLLNDFYTSALQRREGSRPFYLYLDECADYLTGDVARMLDQTRKFGLHLTLAHQRLGQLRARGENIYDAVMEGAQTKIVFGVREMENAKTLATDLFASTFNLETPKPSMNRPVVVGQVPVWLESLSETQGSASGYGTSRGSAKGLARGKRMDEDMDDAIEYETESETDTDTESYNETTSESTTKGKHQTFQNTFEDRPTQLYSLEELVFLAAQRLREMQPRQIVVQRVNDKQPLTGLTRDIHHEFVSPTRLDTVKLKVLERSGVVTPLTEAQTTLEERHRALESHAQPKREDTPEYAENALGRLKK